MSIGDYRHVQQVKQVVHCQQSIRETFGDKAWQYGLRGDGTGIIEDQYIDKKGVRIIDTRRPKYPLPVVIDHMKNR